MSPVNLVNIEGAALSFGGGAVLAGISLGVAEGDRIGVVGRNGAGKTTLMRVLAGLVEPDVGRVTRTSGLRTGLLAQGDDLEPGASVRAVVLGGRADHDWASERATREAVDVLVGASLLDRRVDELSGGERRRVALAALLVHDPDLLLLDEPTNHLDIETIDWLAGRLAARRGALVSVTHDRWFLDATCTRTWEVDSGQVAQYDGGYAAYVLARAERERVAAVGEERRRNLLRKELAWLRRGPPARTSKPRFRIDAANALIADEPPARDTMRLASFANRRLGRSVFDLEAAGLSFGEHPILDAATWRLGPGERVGLVGVNGSGKTTLLRVLAGLQPLDAGELRTGSTVRIGYLSQHVAELEPGLRVLETIEQVRRQVVLGDGRELSASALLERFGFSGTRQWTPVGDLSGGERRRLQLLRLLMDEPNVLLLDEPTNDLDVDALTALEDLLDGWVGTIVAASHDRYFLERACDTVVALLDSRVVALPGGVDDYLARRSSAPSSQPSNPPSSGADAGQPASQPAAGSAALAREARKELVRIERQLARLEAQQTALHEQLAAAASDYLAAGRLDEQLRALQAQHAQLEDDWLAAAEQAGR